MHVEEVGKTPFRSSPTSSTDSIQNLRIDGTSFINVYLPTVDTTLVGKEKLEQSLSDLDRTEFWNPYTLHREPVVVCGDRKSSRTSSKDIRSSSTHPRSQQTILKDGENLQRWTTWRAHITSRELHKMR